MFYKMSKRNICSNWLLNKMGLASRMVVAANILNKFKVKDEYTLNVNSSDEEIEITYNGEKFGLEELSKIEIPHLYEGGRGKNVLVNNPNIKYSYKETSNTWIIMAKTTKPLNMSITVRKGELGNTTVKFLSWLEIEEKDFEKGYDELIEIVSNIFYNTNIEEQRRIITLVVLCEYLKLLVKREFGILYTLSKLRKLVKSTKEDDFT